MVKSRLLAYVLDIFIITIVLNILGNFFINRDNYSKLNEELEILTENYVNGKVTADVYINNQADILKDLDKENIFVNIIQSFLIVGYFIFLPYYNNGKTLGKMLFKVRIVPEDGELDYNKLIIRAILINGLGYLLISMAGVYVLPSLAYYILTSILGLIEFFILVASLIMMIKDKEHRGLHDKLSKTKVIND